MPIEDEAVQQRVSQQLRKLRRLFIHLILMIAVAVGFGVLAEYSKYFQEAYHAMNAVSIIGPRF